LLLRDRIVFDLLFFLRQFEFRQFVERRGFKFLFVKTDCAS
jgi:hypothetical protein